jgi:hypothetical protein
MRLFYKLRSFAKVGFCPDWRHHVVGLALKDSRSGIDCSARIALDRLGLSAMPTDRLVPDCRLLTTTALVNSAGEKRV